MKYTRFFYLVVIVALLASLLSLARSAQAQTTLPTAVQVASQITVGINIGNTLEAICGENAWGNPNVSQTYINAVKAAGFNAVRIPVAWDCHSTNNTIDPAWMARVKQVVDYAISQNMYVIINIHWDNGWLENNPTYAAQAAVNVKQNAYWTQIANTFKNYNERVLFAGTNEVHFDYGTPTTEHITVHQSYLQTFVNAVRATGGNNASRTLVVQTYNTNIQHGLNYFTLPTDSASNRLMVEVHYYDPYDYTLNTSGPCLAWGAPFTQYSQCSWAQEAYMDSLFAQVKNKWVNQGIPVIIGEYTVSARPNLDMASRPYYYRYMNNSARINGIKTFLWDTGGAFNRNTGAITEQDSVNAIMQGAGVGIGVPTPTRTPVPTTQVPVVTNTPTRTLTPPPGITNTPTRTSPPTGGVVTRVRYFPRSTFSNRMTGGIFQGSNTSTTTGFVNLVTIATQPTENTWSELTFSNATAYRYLRYLAPNAGYGNVAEVEFYSGATRLTGTGFGTAGAWNNGTTTFDKALDGNTTTFFDAATGDGIYVGIDTGVSGPTNTPTRTPTQTVGASPTRTLTPAISNTPTRTPTRTLTPGISNTPTRTFTPPPGITNTPTRTPTQGTGGTCSPVSATITAPFVKDGAGAFCWQSSNLGAYINSWNTASVTINGVNATNIWMGSGSYPAKIGGFWYIAYNSTVAWGHFEAK